VSANVAAEVEVEVVVTIAHRCIDRSVVDVGRL